MTGSNLRVGYVLKRFPRLSETFILNEMLELERQGVEVEVFSLFKPPAEDKHALLSELKARVTYLPSSPAIEQLTLKQTVDGIESERKPVASLVSNAAFDDAMPGKSAVEKANVIYKAATVALLAKELGLQHLHAHFGSDAATVALLASRLSHLPFSFTAHAKDIYHTYIDKVTDARMRSAKISEAAFVATVSEFNRQHLIGIADRADSGRIHRLYNGIDLDRFRDQRLSREPATILAVGRLVEKKGFTHLIEACGQLSRRSVEFRCDIAGDGPLQEFLAQQIETCGLIGKVRLLGPRKQEELIGMMQTATLMVLPCIVTDSGDRDGLPTVLLEALASGLPCISTTVSGVPEIIQDGESGLLTRPDSADQMADAIETLLASPKRRDAFARAGRMKAERDFSLSRNVATLRSLFEQCQHFSKEESNETLLRVS